MLPTNVTTHIAFVQPGDLPTLCICHIRLLIYHSLSLTLVHSGMLLTLVILSNSESHQRPEPRGELASSRNDFCYVFFSFSFSLLGF